jgi:ABC-2 type transport system permease protein
VLLFPLMFTAGIFFPVNNVPVWLEVIAKVNPVTYGVDAVRQLFLSKELAAMAEAPGGGAGVLRVTVFGHQMTMVEDVLVVAIMCAVLTFAAAWAFSRQE